VVTELSVLAGISRLLLLDPAVREVDRAAGGLDMNNFIVPDPDLVLLLDRQLHVDDRERVEAHVLEGCIRILRDLRLRNADAIDEDVFEISECEPLLFHRLLLCSCASVSTDLTGAAQSRIGEKPTQGCAPRASVLPSRCSFRG